MEPAPSFDPLQPRAALFVFVPNRTLSALGISFLLPCDGSVAPLLSPRDGSATL